MSNLPVFTVRKTVVLENVVAFGDAEDILNEVMRSEEGTIAFTIDARRQFMPGKYAMHIVGPDTTQEGELATKCSAIICREDLDPKLIHNLLIDSNCDGNNENPQQNQDFISRYDWMHCRNWFGNGDTSDEDSDGPAEAKEMKKKFKASLSKLFDCNISDLVYFVNANRMVDVVSGTFTVDRAGESIYVMTNKALRNPVIGFVINTGSEAHSFVFGDWHYACLLTDQNSKKKFAFVFGELYVRKHLLRNEGAAAANDDHQNDQFTYNIEQFRFKK